MNIRNAALTVLSITLKIVVMAVVILGLLKIGSVSYRYGHAVFQEEAVDEAPGRNASISITEDDSIIDIGKKLQSHGLIEDWKLFFIQAKLSKYAKTMESGAYVLNTSYKPKQMMAIMSGEEIETDSEEDKN